MSARDYVEKDYYAALGVPKTATAAEVKRAYRKLARQLHPDKNPGDSKAEARFKDVSAAYDVLSDDARRKEYDEARALFGSGGFRGPRPGAAAGGAAGGFPFDLGDLMGNARSGGLGDLFGGLFGGTGRGPQRGQDLAAEVTISFEDALRGLLTAVRLPGAAACDTCRGLGSAPGTAPRSCATCHGTGLSTRNQGGFALSEPCRDCRGTGSVIDTPCPDCGGTGRRERLQKIRLPAGVSNGQRVRVRGRGTPGARGGPAGDLEVLVHVGTNPVFGRDGAALTLTLPVTFPEAALGATVSVPTLDGPVTLKIPPGTTSGRRLRVKDRGFPVAGGGRGPLIVTVEVAVPAKLSGKAKSALEAFAAESQEDPRGHLAPLLGAVAGGG
ncbi:MAG: molecular chaperone DnaJ [Mycobacteriales bacterium]